MKKYFYFLIFISLVSALLMIVHNNAPMVFSYFYGWGPLFIISTLIFSRGTFFSKIIQLNLFFFVAYAVILPIVLWINMNEWFLFRQYTIFLNVLIPITIFVWLKNNYNPKLWIIISKVAMIFILITSLMTIIASQINPMIVRASYSSGAEEIVDFMFFRKLGIGSYGYMVMLASMFPPLVYFYKKDKLSKKKKGLVLVIIMILYFTLIKAQIFANILTATIFILIAYMGPRYFKRNIIFFVLFGIVFILIPDTFWANLFISISKLFESGSELHYKFTDFANFIMDKQVGDSTTGAGSRAARYPELIINFLNNPIFGKASFFASDNNELSHGGGHLFWMSRLAIWGIFGFGFFIWLLIKNYKIVSQIFDKEFQFYYLLSFLSFGVLGLMKSLEFLESFLWFFVIIPGLYLYYKEDNV